MTALAATGIQGGLKPMKSCPGQLVVHRDGTVAYCTEEQDGRACAGEDRPHRRGVLACRVVTRDPCSACNPVPLTTPQLTRH